MKLEKNQFRTLNVEDDPGAGRSSRGFGRASFLECLDRLGKRLNPAIPATCASGVSDVGNLSQTHQRQVMSPNSSQTLPQDPLHVQDPPRVDTYLRSEETSSKCEEETPTSAPKREEFDVKEEPESPGLREGETAHPSQRSELPEERSGFSILCHE